MIVILFLALLALDVVVLIRLAWEICQDEPREHLLIAMFFLLVAVTLAVGFLAEQVLP